MKSNQLEATIDALQSKKPFCELTNEGFALLKENANIKYFEIGERITRHDEFPAKYIYC